jgi:molecular chaperone GrpE
MEDERESPTVMGTERDAGPVREPKGLECASEAAPQVPPAPPDADVGELTATIQQLQAEKQRLYDRLLRKQAELENLRKRTQREKEELLNQANADLIRSLLPSLDGFERALKHRAIRVPDEFYKGMEMIYRGLLDVLKREGLTPIEALGQKFDPHLHQAVESVEDDRHRDQEVVEELLRGYNFKHRLLRPSIVKVAVATR